MATDPSAKVDTGRRLALLIGNNSYRVSPLKNPVNDAMDLDNLLKTMGFETEVVLNANYSRMFAAIREFENKVQQGDTVLVAYAGHGLGIANDNFLLPIDFEAKSAQEGKEGALSANQIMQGLRSRGPVASILILDACRENPPGSSAGGSLVHMEVDGAFIAFAATPGRYASDNPAGRNGLFTKHLLNTLRQFGQESIANVFQKVSEAVSKESKGNQVPSTVNALGRPFVFVPMSEEEAAVAQARATLRDRGIALDVINVKNALMSDDVEMLELFVAAAIPPSVIEEAFRQKVSGEKTTVARRFFENSRGSLKTLNWFKSVIAAGVNPNLTLPHDYYVREGVLIEAVRAANVPAIKALLENGASPHAYQDLTLTRYSLTRFLQPLKFIADSDRLTLEEKQELAKAFVKAGLVVPKVIYPKDRSGWSSTMYEVKLIRDDVAPKLGLSLPPSPTYCEQPQNPICKQAGGDWCSVIEKMPNKLINLGPRFSPLWDVTLLHLLNIEENKAYFLGLTKQISWEYVLVEVSKDGSSWTVLKFMGQELATGRCRDPEGQWYSNMSCWGRIPIRRIAATDQMRFEMGNTTWKLGRESCSSLYPEEAIKADASKPPKTEVPSGRDDGALPLTAYRAALLTVRDVPQVASDQAMIEITKGQISTEQRAWDMISRIGTPESTFVFEWQKYVERQPAMARGPLLGVFLRPDADWGFVSKEKGWNEQAKNGFVDVFVFSRDKIEGRAPDFTARELAPVFKRHLEMAASQAPTRLWFSVHLPNLGYDFGAKALRFLKPYGERTDFFDNIILLRELKRGIFEPPPDVARARGFLLPNRARNTANYEMFSGYESRSLISAEPPMTKPGERIEFWGVGGNVKSPTEAWRNVFPSFGSSPTAFPQLKVLAFDRQLQLASIPLDAAQAEALEKKKAAAGCRDRCFQARVIFEAERVELGEHIYERGRSKQAVLFARVMKIEILGPENELIATILPADLPGALVKPAPSPSPQAKQSTVKAESTEQSRDQMLKAAEERSRIKLKEFQEEQRLRFSTNNLVSRYVFRAVLLETCVPGNLTKVRAELPKTHISAAILIHDLCCLGHVRIRQTASEETCG